MIKRLYRIMRRIHIAQSGFKKRLIYMYTEPHLKFDIGVCVCVLVYSHLLIFPFKVYITFVHYRYKI